MGNHGTQSYGTTGADDQIATMTPMSATPPEDVFLAFLLFNKRNRGGEYDEKK
jgi:hypothetical protein